MKPSIQEESLKEKLRFEHRILDGTADDAIRSIHQVRNVQQLMELHDYEINHRKRKSVDRALIQRFKHLAQQQQKQSKH